MTEPEGVIQFELQHSEAPPLTYPVLAELSLWHQELHGFGLIGQDRNRYGGYAFGNMSYKIDEHSFIISGTQTGGLSELDASHYVLVESCDIKNNKVTSRGPLKPSSECMSHAAIYTATDSAQAVVHTHSPAIWKNHKALQLFTTASDIAYGTPGMAEAISNCIHIMGDTRSGTIVMLGHEDGVITFAGSVQEASEISIALLEQASLL